MGLSVGGGVSFGSSPQKILDAATGNGTLSLSGNATTVLAQTGNGTLVLPTGNGTLLTTTGNGSQLTGLPAPPSPSGAENLVYATPDGASGNATLRALTADDLPSIPAPTLEAVTTAGADTDQGLTLSGGASLAGSSLVFVASGAYAVSDGSDGINFVDANGNVVNVSDGVNILTDGGGHATELFGTTLHAALQYYEPLGILDYGVNQSYLTNYQSGDFSAFFRIDSRDELPYFLINRYDASHDANYIPDLSIDKGGNIELGPDDASGNVDVRGTFSMNGTPGFTGSGIYTTFTVENGIITGAS